MEITQPETEDGTPPATPRKHLAMLQQGIEEVASTGSPAKRVQDRKRAGVIQGENEA